MACTLPDSVNGPAWIVIKAAGDNAGLKVDNTHGKVDYFVATNRAYNTEREAEFVAQELALKTPGNRYYVAPLATGFMAPDPQLEVRRYF